MKNQQIRALPHIPQKLQELRNLSDKARPCEKLFYIGDPSLLEAPFKVAIVGSRKPNQYARHITATLSAKLAQMGAVIVSGGALGTDIIAHQNAHRDGRLSTIMISPSSLDIIYPQENRKIIAQIAQDALILSEYERDYMPHRFSFLERNRLVVGLADAVIIPHADIKSGSMNSASWCDQLQKPLFVLPHRLNESTGTQRLLATHKAQCIYDIDEFLRQMAQQIHALNPAKNMVDSDEILAFCKNCVPFQDAVRAFGDRIYEYEIQGKLKRKNGLVMISDT